VVPETEVIAKISNTQDVHLPPAKNAGPMTDVERNGNMFTVLLVKNVPNVIAVKNVLERNEMILIESVKEIRGRGLMEDTKEEHATNTGEPNATMEEETNGEGAIERGREVEATEEGAKKEGEKGEKEEKKEVEERREVTRKIDTGAITGNSSVIPYISCLLKVVHGHFCTHGK